jgi:hypothetical protein
MSVAPIARRPHDNRAAIGECSRQSIGNALQVFVVMFMP